jgi:hypothetical protein
MRIRIWITQEEMEEKSRELLRLTMNSKTEICCHIPKSTPDLHLPQSLNERCASFSQGLRQGGLGPLDVRQVRWDLAVKHCLLADSEPVVNRGL